MAFRKTANGMTPFATRKVRNFAALQELALSLTGKKDTSGLVFRGHYGGDVNEPPSLVTGLERICRGLDAQTTRATEIALIREFSRRAHHYLRDVPDAKQGLEWLALMQHHGAPTRLLDWTYSLQVAAHFALGHTSRREKENMAVWIMNADWCVHASEKVWAAAAKPVGAFAANPSTRESEKAAFAQLLSNRSPRSVWPLNPFRLNERLTIQKGVFLAPVDPTVTFAANLRRLAGWDDEQKLVCAVIPRREMLPISRLLYDANVTEATLFPGIDGFARSLQNSFRFLKLEGMSPTSI